MSILRSPNGCPWDREQTHESLLPYLLEESYEFIDSVKSGDVDAMKEELGDLLLQIAFHAQLAEERGLFNFADVDQAISDKMVRRHPHVFGDASSADLDHRWEELKHSEREQKGLKSVLDDIPLALPAVSRAEKIQRRAAKVGFDWDEISPVFAKIEEEMDEIRRAIDGDGDIHEEVGDLLFACVNLARKLDVKAEMALDDTNRKFEARFRQMETTVLPKSLADYSLDELEALWVEAKNAQKG
ncbi:MAG: nucleoside triphosphate pyrophosphohydrolase [Gammaproteobacteria bacterium]|nr:nucleoside triphosphate pyrophosphohydrolase [Gammaproteobacteria bacterium]